MDIYIYTYTYHNKYLYRYTHTYSYNLVCIHTHIGAITIWGVEGGPLDAMRRPLPTHLTTILVTRIRLYIL